MNSISINKQDMLLMAVFIAAVLAGPVILKPFGAGYPDLSLIHI